ncbi:MAG: hypothetical protein ACRDRX_02445 [Pseudonocardiaceae bacterium]
MSAPALVTGPAHLDPCPYCGATSGMQVITGTPLKVRGWSCTPCGGQWWTSVVNPRPWLDHLTATVELAAARSVLRELLRLADQAPVLTEEQLRFRLLALAECGAPRAGAPPRSSAGRWPSETPDSAPSGQPAPHDTAGTAP